MRKSKKLLETGDSEVNVTTLTIARFPRRFSLRSSQCTGTNECSDGLACIDGTCSDLGSCVTGTDCKTGFCVGGIITISIVEFVQISSGVVGGGDRFY